MRAFSLFAWCSLFLVSGCATPETTTPFKETPAKKDDGTTTTSTDTNPGGSTTTNPSTASDPAPTRDKIAATLKTEGYRYFGLANPQSPTFEMTGSPAGFKTGGYDMELVELKGDSATFRQTWTGGLSGAVESSEYQVTSKGVFASAVGASKVDPPRLEMPATPSPGFAWKSEAKLELGGATLHSNQFKIEKMAKVKVKMGTYDALVVSGRVEGTQNGKPLSMTMTSYYVKDIGPVKLTISGKNPDGKQITTVLEATKKP